MKASTRSSIAFLVILVVTLATLPALSAGFGAYFEYAHTDGELDLDFNGFGTSADELDLESDKFGFGFVLDTNLARDRLLNYRLTVGYQRTNREYDDVVLGSATLRLGDIDADGFTFNNVLGFGLSRGPSHRLWIGPAVRLGVDVFDTGSDDVDIVDISIGGGAAIGLNIHSEEHLTVGLTAGYQYLYISEVISVDVPGFDETESFDAYEHVAMANITVFFRTSGDHFD
jgi:hypothetical protein